MFSTVLISCSSTEAVVWHLANVHRLRTNSCIVLQRKRPRVETPTGDQSLDDTKNWSPYLETLENLLPIACILFLTHTSPHIRINNICTLHSLCRIMADFDSAYSCSTSSLYCSSIRLVPLRACTYEMEREYSCQAQPGVHHVVAIPYVHYLQPVSMHSMKLENWTSELGWTWVSCFENVKIGIVECRKPHPFQTIHVYYINK